MRNLCLALMLFGLAGCIGSKAEPPKGNPITGDAIAVTALDTPAAQPNPSGQPNAGAQPNPAAQPATPPPGSQPPPAKPANKPAAAAAQPAQTVEAPPPPPPSAAELACTKSGGQWAGAGGKSLFSCVHLTKDSGKQCSKATQCEGLCLARSGTCAPVVPLFGCNEIFQDNGARVTLCID